MAVAQPHEAVVQVVEVGDGGAGPLARSADDGEKRVQDGNAEDEERDDDRGEKEVRPATELVRVLAHHRHRRGCHENSQ